MKEVYLNQTQNLVKWNKQAYKFPKPQYINKKEKKNPKRRILEDQPFGFDYDWEKEWEWTVDGDKGFSFF